MVTSLVLAPVQVDFFFQLRVTHAEKIAETEIQKKILEDRVTTARHVISVIVKTTFTHPVSDLVTAARQRSGLHIHAQSPPLALVTIHCFLALFPHGRQVWVLQGLLRAQSLGGVKVQQLREQVYGGGRCSGELLVQALQNAAGDTATGVARVHKTK